MAENCETRTEEQKRYLTEFIQGLSDMQRQNYEKFKWLLSEKYGFYKLTARVEPSGPDSLFVGESDGYLDYLTYAEIKGDGGISLRYPISAKFIPGPQKSDLKSAVCSSFKESLDEVIELRKKLEERGVEYTENIDRREYVGQIEGEFKRYVADMTSKIILGH